MVLDVSSVAISKAFKIADLFTNLVLILFLLVCSYSLLAGSQDPYILKTLREQRVAIERLCQENIELPHLQHHSM